MCGATSAQNNIQQQQLNNYNTATQQAQQVFGNSSSVFNDLVKTFSPVVAAGPSQQGYSPQELANLNSQAITNVGQSYKNEKQALGDSQAAQGGGRAVLPGGANIGTQDALAENAGNATASALSGITQAGYAQGNKNWTEAAAGLSGAPAVFGASTNSLNAGTSAGNAASNTANQIAQAANSPWQAAIGALGGVAGAAAGNPAGLTSMFGGAAPSSSSVIPGATPAGADGGYAGG